MTSQAEAGKPQRGRRFKLTVSVIATVVVVVVVVVLARLIRLSDGGQSFLATYPGSYTLPSFAPLGFPLWLQWQHAINAFFIVLIVRTGWLVRIRARPPAFWTRDNKRFIKTRNPPKKISLDLWLHLSLDFLWVLNGVLFIVLIFSTGQWTRIVPTSWEVFPNAVSAALQYASLQWPTEDGWVNYNGLQQLSYFVIVFIAAPVSILTGLRMSNAWPKGTTRLNRIYPVELARAVHFPTMIFWVAFVVVHVALVLSTGALRNLNHMFWGSDDVNWLGFIMFIVSIVIIGAAWIFSKPIFLSPLASISGKVSAR